MSNHTPGPWLIENGRLGIYVHAKQQKSDRPYKILASFSTSENNAEANAKLISAAPEMLQALQAALKLSDDCFEADKAAGYETTRTPECQAVYDQVKAAIQKATL